MDDSAYAAMVARFGDGDRAVMTELAAEARRRGDRRVLAAIDLRSGPSAKEARAAGDRLALGRAIAGRAGLWRTWDPLVQEVSRWPDDDASRAAVAALARALDELELDELREAPAAWWNAAQRGAAPVGWPLVRRLIFRERAEALVPCEAPDSLAELTSIDADERSVAPAQLAGARRLRALAYEFLSSVPRPGDPVEPIAALARTLVELSIALPHAGTDLTGLRALTALTDLRIQLRFDDFGGRDPLAALGGMTLSTLEVASRAALPSLAVLDQLAALRVLHVDRAPADPAPIGRLAQLEELLLGRAAGLPRLPASLRSLHLVECDGLRSSEPLASLTGLEVLRLTDCRALRELHAGTLAALRELAILGGPDGTAQLERIELGAAPHLEELRLDGLPALRELRFSGGRPASLRQVSVERCPALVIPADVARG